MATGEGTRPLPEAPPPPLLPSAGAVAAALDVVEDLLLQLLPLLLLLGETSGGQLAGVQAAAVAEDAAVLSVPQLGVQAARLGQKGAVVAALGHSALVGEERWRRLRRANAQSVNDCLPGES